MQKLIFRQCRRAARVPAITPKLVDANNPRRIKRCRLELERNACHSPLQAIHSHVQSERYVHVFPAKGNMSMPSLSPEALPRNWNHRMKTSEFSIISTFGISLGFRHDEHLSSLLTHCRTFTNSSRWMNRPSARVEEGSSTNHEENYETSTCKSKKSVADHDIKKSDSDFGDTAPINQRATNAILSQLSSPPNLLTLSRILATPYLSYLLISHNGKISSAASSPVLDGFNANDPALSSPISLDASLDQISTTPAFALSLFLVMGFTDFLDGYIARLYPSTATVLGTYLDPFADKVFISITSLTLWYTGTLPGLLVGLWVARDVGIVGTAYWLVRQETVRKQSNEDQDSASSNNNIAVMDPQNTPLKVQASLMSKANTALQIGLIALGIAGEVPSITIPPELMTSMIWITAGTTIGSSFGYLDGSAMLKSGNK